MVVLPHRDVSVWGETSRPIEIIVEHCVSEVKAADVLVAIAAESFGAHVEIGVALGVGLPVLLITSTSVPQSFFAGGLCESALVTKVAVSDLDLRGPLSDEAVRSIANSVLTIMSKMTAPKDASVERARAG
jgi:hypothetical protein